ncbi:hypothetical protein V1511DRAFT_496369 [Dipodascopsis uninucleata]
MQVYRKAGHTYILTGGSRTIAMLMSMLAVRTDHAILKRGVTCPCSPFVSVFSGAKSIAMSTAEKLEDDRPTELEETKDNDIALNILKKSDKKERIQRARKSAFYLDLPARQATYFYPRFEIDENLKKYDTALVRLSREEKRKARSRLNLKKVLGPHFDLFTLDNGAFSYPQEEIVRNRKRLFRVYYPPENGKKESGWYRKTIKSIDGATDVLLRNAKKRKKDSKTDVLEIAKNEPWNDPKLKGFVPAVSNIVDLTGSRRLPSTSNSSGNNNFSRRYHSLALSRMHYSFTHRHLHTRAVFRNQLSSLEVDNTSVRLRRARERREQAKKAVDGSKFDQKIETRKPPAPMMNSINLGDTNSGARDFNHQISEIDEELDRSEQEEELVMKELHHNRVMKGVARKQLFKKMMKKVYEAQHERLLAKLKNIDYREGENNVYYVNRHNCKEFLEYKLEAELRGERMRLIWLHKPHSFDSFDKETRAALLKHVEDTAPPITSRKCQKDSMSSSSRSNSHASSSILPSVAKDDATKHSDDATAAISPTTHSRYQQALGNHLKKDEQQQYRKSMEIQSSQKPIQDSVDRYPRNHVSSDTGDLYQDRRFSGLRDVNDNKSEEEITGTRMIVDNPYQESLSVIKKKHLYSVNHRIKLDQKASKVHNDDIERIDKFRTQHGNSVVQTDFLSRSDSLKLVSKDIADEPFDKLELPRTQGEGDQTSGGKSELSDKYVSPWGKRQHALYDVDKIGRLLPGGRLSFDISIYEDLRAQYLLKLRYFTFAYLPLNVIDHPVQFFRSVIGWPVQEDVIWLTRQMMSWQFEVQLKLIFPPSFGLEPITIVAQGPDTHNAQKAAYLKLLYFLHFKHREGVNLSHFCPGGKYGPPAISQFCLPSNPLSLPPVLVSWASASYQRKSELYEEIVAEEDRLTRSKDQEAVKAWADFRNRFRLLSSLYGKGYDSQKANSYYNVSMSHKFSLPKGRILPEVNKKPVIWMTAFAKPGSPRKDKAKRQVQQSKLRPSSIRGSTRGHVATRIRRSISR